MLTVNRVICEWRRDASRDRDKNVRQVNEVQKCLLFRCFRCCCRQIAVNALISGFAVQCLPDLSFGPGRGSINIGQVKIQ